MHLSRSIFRISGGGGGICIACNKDNILLPFSVCMGFFLGLPPSLRKFLRGPCSGVVENFLSWNAIMVTYGGEVVY